MNILFISAVLPYPLHSGGQVRLFNLLKLLSKHHDITLYAFIRSDDERKYVKDLSFIKNIKLFFRGYAFQPRYILRSLTSSLPLLVSSYEHREMKNDLLDALRGDRYDLVHLEPFYTAASMPKNIHCPVVVSEHNIEYQVYESYVSQFSIPFVRPFLKTDVQKIQKQEQSAWEKARSVIAVSDRDASVIRKEIGEGKVTVIPNGVDTSYFSYEKKLFNGKHPRFLFVGNFYWMPNVKAVERLFEEIWPKIRKMYPHGHLTVIGKHLSQKLQEKGKTLHFSYKESVEDIRDAYKTSDILLAPMTISGGTKFKMLEAMGSGCFVVTTREGMEGIDMQNGIHYYEASSVSDYVSSIEAVYRNPSKSQEMTARARRVIETKYDWKSQAAKLSHVWKSAI